MADLEILARNHSFGVSTTNGSYTTISGINNFTIGEDVNEEDARDFADGGNANDYAVSRKVTITLEGRKLVDTATGTRDAGQALVEASMGNKFGTSRLRYYRIAMVKSDEDPTEIGSFVFRGSAKSAEMGGGNDDLYPWGAEIGVNGNFVSASGVYADLD